MIACQKAMQECVTFGNRKYSRLPSSSHISKYGSVHPRQVELTRMVFNDFIIALDLPLSITEKPAFIQAMNTVDPKFRIPSRRSITSDYLSKLHEQIINKLKNACSLADFLSLTFDGWTDRRLQTFYAVKMHYIDQMEQLKTHLLGFNPLSVEIYYDLENELKLYKYTSSICNTLFKSVKERFGGLLLNLEKPVDDHL
ncbi:unnamed protein product [Rotaria sp. Silwood2]|nr:unnamed protein product [Rotaria sp. Silwood2]CAF3350809.1 unnamed protein product [Rotaria sp. Silwood2]CAF4295519.1 unnamed protein product [Rotaria sp. Silwood2]